MRRVFASFALLFVLGSFAAPAWATLAAPQQHACCLRKAHHCGTTTATVKSTATTEPCCGQCTVVTAQRPATTPRPLRIGPAHDPHPFLTEFLPAFNPLAETAPAAERAPPANPPGQ
jgi:hypothetical protein